MDSKKKLQGPLIQIIDDDLMTRLLMRTSLENAGYRVIEAENGVEAISEFSKLRPDVILLDVMMPEMDGFETCKAIRSLPGGEHIPILMITGLEDINSIHDSFNSGATDFISKPINWAILNYRVKYMLRASEAFYDVVSKQEQIQQLAFFDHLTGLSNRTLFKETLEAALTESTDENLKLAVLFMDLDRFKLINDTLGHHAGDYLLKNVAERISLCVRDTDSFGRLNKKNSKHYISRLGGDEFTILLPCLNDPEDAGRVARRINKKLSEPFLLNETEVHVSASIGISIFPFDGTDAEKLMKHADLAMYHAKERGKSNFQYYKKSLNIKAKEQLEFENDVRKAVANSEFEFYYQPQIDLKNGTIVGAEALARWQHGIRGAVSPVKFVPAIEELGLIVPFTDWVIRQIGMQQREWQCQGLSAKRIAINISSKQFVHQNIPHKISEVIRDYNLEPQLLELELTESVLAEQSDETLSVLRKIKNMGISISVDDFGTGYSSLVYLKTFPIDIVKIDRFFIKDILTSQQDSAIVKAIIAMAHSMNMKVVAEGIEEKGQCTLLQEMGCDFGQGFLFSPAVPERDFSQMLCAETSFFVQ